MKKFPIRALTLFFIVSIVTPQAIFAQYPTISEIALQNEASWIAIKTIDMDYAVVSEYCVDNKDYCDASLQNRWTYSNQCERLVRIYDLGESSTLLSDSFLDQNSLRERQTTKDETGTLSCGTISPPINPLWQNRINLSPFLMRYPCGEIDMDTTKTLAWILTHWDAAIEHSSVTPQNDTLWHIKVQCPEEFPWGSGTMQIVVNQNKGFLVERVIITGLDLGTGCDEEPDVETVEMEILEYYYDGEKYYFPCHFVCRHFSEPKNKESVPDIVYKEIPTRVEFNHSLPEDRLSFQFERGEIITEYDSLSEIVGVYVWGNDNRPERTFASYEELDEWQFRQDVAALVTDIINLPRIIGKDLGATFNSFLLHKKHSLFVLREKQKQQLKAIADVPITVPSHSDASPLPVVSSDNVKSDAQATVVTNSATTNNVTIPASTHIPSITSVPVVPVSLAPTN